MYVCLSVCANSSESALAEEKKIKNANISQKTEKVFTSVAVIQIGKLLPLVILHQADERTFDIRPHLQNKLV